jgi:hypothetical protein
MGLDGWLEDLKPSNELAAVITTLQSNLRIAKGEIKDKIADGELNIAEQHLAVIDLYCTVLSGVATVEGTPHSKLLGHILSKRYPVCLSKELTFTQIEFSSTSVRET